MAKNSIEAYGAEGKTNVLMFDPDRLTLVTDEQHALYDERVHLPLDEAMVLNIMAIGVKQPINIVKDRETGQTLVSAGRQRVKHAREANRRLREQGQPTVLVPGVVDHGDPSATSISENELRRSDTPLGRAKKMAALLARGRSEAWLATMFGCTVQTVRNTLALLDSTADVRQAVESGQITASAAQKIARMEPQAQREAVAKVVAAGEGATGHAKSRAQREALEPGKPKMRSRREVEKAYETAGGEAKDALGWVLGK